MFKALLAATCLTLSTAALADLSVPVYFIDANNQGKLAGMVLVKETKYGLLFTPDLHGLNPGLHGFHVHQNPSCDNNGDAAGGHLNPGDKPAHSGPYSDAGHYGDLPVMYVSADGTATTPTLAPRIMHSDEIKNHSLMIHEGGDNYSDTPNKLGGGGGRMICGVIK
jgi:Cu-Zn family superoxide dismutase